MFGSKFDLMENKGKKLATSLAHLRKVWWISEKKSGNTVQDSILQTFLTLFTQIFASVGPSHVKHFASSSKANGRKPKSCLGRVVRFKLGSFSIIKEVSRANVRPCGEVLRKGKTQYS